MRKPRGVGTPPIPRQLILRINCTSGVRLSRERDNANVFGGWCFARDASSSCSPPIFHTVMTVSSATWRTFFESRGLQKALIDSYMLYVQRMLAARLPPIFEHYHLAKLLGRTDSYLASAVNCADRHYRTFAIPKRRGGKREISAPYPALLECQQWIDRSK